MISTTSIVSTPSPLAVPEECGPEEAGAMEQDAQALIQKSALSEALKQKILDSPQLLRHIQDFYPEAECILKSALADRDQYRCLSSVAKHPFNLIGCSILAHIRAFRDEAGLILESSLDSEDKKRCLSATTAYGENLVLRYIRALRPEAEWLLASTLSSCDKARGLSFTTSSSSAEKSTNVILQNLRDFLPTYLFPLFIDTEDSSQRYLRLSTRHEWLQPQYQTHPFRPLLKKLLRRQLPARALAQWLLSYLKDLPAPAFTSWKKLPDQIFIQWTDHYWNKLPVQRQVQWIPLLKDLPALLTWLTQVAPELSKKSSNHPSRPALNLDVLAHITYFSFPFVPREEIMQLHHI